MDDSKMDLLNWRGGMRPHDYGRLCASQCANDSAAEGIYPGPEKHSYSESVNYNIVKIDLYFFIIFIRMKIIFFLTSQLVSHVKASRKTKFKAYYLLINLI